MRSAQLRHFIAVADGGSITAAANKLGISQPAVTKSVRELEHELGVPLLHRSNRGIALTEYGQLLYERGRRANLELAKAEQEIAQLAGQRAGRVAFGIGPYGAFLLVRNALVNFQQRFALNDVRIVEGFVHVLVPLVRQGILDFTIGPRFAHEPNTGVQFRPLFQHQQIVIGRLGHPLAKATSLSQLLSAQWLTFEPRVQTQLIFSRLGLPVPVIVECESYSAFTQLLVSTDMLGIASVRMLEKQPYGNTLRQILVTDPILPLTSGIYTRMDTQLTPASEAMASAIMEEGKILIGQR